SRLMRKITMHRFDISILQSIGHFYGLPVCGVIRQNCQQFRQSFAPELWSSTVTRFGREDCGQHTALRQCKQFVDGKCFRPPWKPTDHDCYPGVVHTHSCCSNSAVRCTTLGKPSRSSGGTTDGVGFSALNTRAIKMSGLRSWGSIRWK